MDPKISLKTENGLFNFLKKKIKKKKKKLLKKMWRQVKT
jgi:hypothetical protein